MKAVSYSKERPNAALLVLLILVALVVGWLSTQVAQASTIYVLEDKPASSVSPVVIVNGNPFISYYDPVQKDLRVAICSNPGCATNTTYFRILDSLGDVGGSPSMVLEDGNPVISYFGENGILKVLACTDSVCSLPVTPITLTSAPTPHGRPSIAVENHHTYIAYRSTDANLFLIACEDVPCSAYSVRTLDVSDANGVIADQVSLLMLNGTPHVSYAKFLYGVQHGNLMVAACVNQTCSVPPIITLVDSDGDVGYASSMISLNGHPFISYINGTSGELRVASCTDSLCSQPAIITPIGMSSTGSDQTSVADFGGIPAVAFTARVENDHQHLKLAVCTNSTCTSATITTLESALNTGNRPTLVNLNGYALVSYSSEAEQRLKVYYGGDFIPPATFTPSNPTPTPSTTWEATDDGTPGSGQPTFTPSPTKTSTVTPEPSVTIGPTLVTPTSVTNAVPVRNYFTNGQVPLSWNPVSWASAYEVQLSTNSNFTDAGDFEFFFHNPLPADRLSFTTLELRNGTYYWRVRAIRADGALGSWSAIQQFTVSAETPTPTRTPTNTPSSTYTPSPTHTWTPSRTATRTPTVTPTPSPTSPAGVPKRPTPTIFPAPTLPSGSCVDGCSP